MAMRGKGRAQMTVEFVVAFPVALVVALTAVNVTLFFSDCAAFDRVFRNAVCAYAPSPSYGQDVSASCGLVQSQLEEVFDDERLEVAVSSSGGAGGVVEFQGSLRFYPTLFGKGRLQGVFGVSFPPLEHTSRIAVDVYRPGVLL